MRTFIIIFSFLFGIFGVSADSSAQLDPQLQLFKKEYIQNPDSTTLQKLSEGLRTFLGNQNIKGISLAPGCTGVSFSKKLVHLEPRKRIEVLAEVLDGLALICPELKELDLSKNLLTTIPKNLELFSSLEALNLEGNRFKHLPGHLWKTFAKLQPGVDLADNPWAFHREYQEISNLDPRRFEVSLGLKHLAYQALKKSENFEEQLNHLPKDLKSLEDPDTIWISSLAQGYVDWVVEFENTPDRNGKIQVPFRFGRLEECNVPGSSLKSSCVVYTYEEIQRLTALLKAIRAKEPLLKGSFLGFTSLLPKRLVEVQNIQLLPQTPDSKFFAKIELAYYQDNRISKPGITLFEDDGNSRGTQIIWDQNGLVTLAFLYKLHQEYLIGREGLKTVPESEATFRVWMACLDAFEAQLSGTANARLVRKTIQQLRSSVRKHRKKGLTYWDLQRLGDFLVQVDSPQFNLNTLDLMEIHMLPTPTVLEEEKEQPIQFTGDLLQILSGDRWLQSTSTPQEK